MASTQNQSAHVDLFDAYLRRADLDRDGRISGNEVVAFFQGSGLPKQVNAQIDRITTHHATLSLMARFREGRPLPAVLPSNVMFDLSNIFQPANDYSNAGNVAWRPASAGGRPPKTVAPSHAEEKQQASQRKPRVTELEKRTEEVNLLNSKFKEATEADKKFSHQAIAYFCRVECSNYRAWS
ncbi:uncharacterized protein LOC126621407 isoform X1 [Malus sylvestris]|uniref:uncharacterized protein LOC126621407 isoform X1 n=1 Tax=Malus sylvestris TaxID=3752 RepID=UPI0021AD2584|nr:uncharacterized protein LOC126621407 isoform X1 [Malus sylvestris]